MILSALTLKLSGVEISMPPLTWEHWVLLGASCLLAYGLAWIIRGFKIRSLGKAAARREKEHANALADQRAPFDAQILESQRKVDDAVSDRAVLEQRFALHREASQRHEKEAQDLVASLDAEIANLQETAAQIEPERARIAELEKAQAVTEERLKTQQEADQKRENEAKTRIAALETDLVAAREVSAQLQPTKARIGDLEAVVASERGRKEALEQMVNVTTQRADDLEKRLRAAQQQLADLETKSHQRLTDLAKDLADRELANSADRARFEKTESEFAKLQEVHTSYQQQAETRIANLQRTVSAAEAKSTVVQKELLGAFGVLPQTPALNGNGSDKRIQGLEDRILQIEAEGRKKAREDSYRIAELEYRLLEAHEALVRAKGGDDKGPPPLPPLPPLLPPGPTQSR